MKYRTLFAEVHKRPGMYGVKDSFWAHVAFVRGVNFGTDRSLLTGFEEFLVPKVGGGTNLSWEALVLALAFPDLDHGQNLVVDEPDRRPVAVDTMFRLLDEFLEIHEQRHGHLRIAADYFAWEKEHRSR
jgi:hypothetical protein